MRPTMAQTRGKGAVRALVEPRPAFALEEESVPHAFGGTIIRPDSDGRSRLVYVEGL